MGTFSGNVVLVTGSSRGIGAAIAAAFAGHGAKVALHGRDETALASVRAEIERRGGFAAQYRAELTSYAEIEEMRRRIEGELGPVDILVANGGGSFTAPGPIEETSEEGWRASIDGNLTATFLTIKSFLPGMKERRAGSILTVSSASGHMPHMQAPIAYSAAKAGIEILTRDVAMQAGPYAIRVNCIAPETILTERNLQRIPDEMKPRLAEAHPLKRLGTPEDVARAALFLASDDALWITGVVLDVSGGAVMAR